MADVCSIKKGVQLNKNKLKDEGLYPVINGGINPSGYWDEYNFDKNLITISQGGASAGYVNYMTTPFWAGAHCYVITHCIDILDYKYLYYFVKMKQQTFMQCQYGAGIPSLSMKTINEIKIPVPPIEAQREIVNILDRFDKICNDISEGIPAEIEARQKQYEYYRDKLLTFHEKT